MRQSTKNERWKLEPDDYFSWLLSIAVISNNSLFLDFIPGSTFSSGSKLHLTKEESNWLGKIVETAVDLCLDCIDTGDNISLLRCSNETRPEQLYYAITKPLLSQYFKANSNDPLRTGIGVFGAFEQQVGGSAASNNHSYSGSGYSAPVFVGKKHNSAAPSYAQSDSFSIHSQNENIHSNFNLNMNQDEWNYGMPFTSPGAESQMPAMSVSSTSSKDELNQKPYICILQDIDQLSTDLQECLIEVMNSRSVPVKMQYMAAVGMDIDKESSTHGTSTPGSSDYNGFSMGSQGHHFLAGNTPLPSSFLFLGISTARPTNDVNFDQVDNSEPNAYNQGSNSESDNENTENRAYPKIHPFLFDEFALRGSIVLPEHHVIHKLLKSKIRGEVVEEDSQSDSSDKGDDHEHTTFDKKKQPDSLSFEESAPKIQAAKQPSAVLATSLQSDKEVSRLNSNLRSLNLNSTTANVKKAIKLHYPHSAFGDKDELGGGSPTGTKQISYAWVNQSLNRRFWPSLRQLTESESEKGALKFDVTSIKGSATGGSVGVTGPNLTSNTAAAASINRTPQPSPKEALRRINSIKFAKLDANDLTFMRNKLRTVHISQEVNFYVKDIIFNLGRLAEVIRGPSPETFALTSSIVKTVAVLNRLDYCTTEHVSEVIIESLAHRVCITDVQNTNDVNTRSNNENSSDIESDVDDEFTNTEESSESVDKDDGREEKNPEVTLSPETPAGTPAHNGDPSTNNSPKRQHPYLRAGLLVLEAVAEAVRDPSVNISN